MTKEESLNVNAGSKVKIKSLPAYNTPVIKDIRVKGQPGFNPNDSRNNQYNRTLRVGETFIVGRKENHGNGVRFFPKDAVSPHAYFTLSNLLVGEDDTSTIKRIQRTMDAITKQIDRLHIKQGILKQKMQYIELSKGKEIKEDEFKAYLLTKVIKDNIDKSDMEKAKLINEVLAISTF